MRYLQLLEDLLLGRDSLETSKVLDFKTKSTGQTFTRTYPEAPNQQPMQLKYGKKRLSHKYNRELKARNKLRAYNNALTKWQKGLGPHPDSLGSPKENTKVLLGLYRAATLRLNKDPLNEQLTIEKEAARRKWRASCTS